MHLVNVFTPVLSQTKQIAATIQQTGKGDYEATVAQIKQVIEQAKLFFESCLQRHIFYQQKHLDHNHYWLSLYAVVVCIDELMIKLKWDGSGKWQNNSFQRTYFDTSMGGKEFFDKLNQLVAESPGDQEVRRVYFYCLCLGFEGEYYLNRDKLTTLIQENYQLLRASEIHASQSRRQTGSDQTVSNAHKERKSSNIGRYKQFLYKVLLVSPLFIVPAIYFIFRFQIIAVSQNISAIF